MTFNGHDPVIDALNQLVENPPQGLVDRVFGSWVRIPGPAGVLYVAFTDRGISYIRTIESMSGDESAFEENFRTKFGRPLRRVDQPPAGLTPALRRGNGARTVPVDLRQLTDFERDVLDATRRIPSGQVRPYAWIAREIGRPRAVRAVGTALGNNPVPVLIPCHRVVRSDGQLGDYVFGRNMKEKLLRAERANVDEVAALAEAKIFFLGSDTTRIVCFPTCAHARRISPSHRVGFRNMVAATAAGYRPCKSCRPLASQPA